jgi:hypothetical protein
LFSDKDSLANLLNAVKQGTCKGTVERWPSII